MPTYQKNTRAIRFPLGGIGSGSVALAWLLCRGRDDGPCAFAFDEPGGRIEVRAQVERGHVTRAMMGGCVRIGGEKMVDIPD